MMTEREALEQGMTVPTEFQAAHYQGIGIEKHHIFFRFLLRAFKKAKVIEKIPKHEKLPPLGPDLHIEELLNYGICFIQD